MSTYKATDIKVFLVYFFTTTDTSDTSLDGKFDAEHWKAFVDTLNLNLSIIGHFITICNFLTHI